MGGNRPVALLFARNVTGALGMLLKQLDEAVAKNRAVELRTIAVFLTSDSKATEAKLKELVQKANLSDNVPLVIPEDPATLKPYKVHPDADVTVVLYRRYKVLDNFAFKAGEFQEKDVKAIIATLPNIIPSKEELVKEAKEDAELRKKYEAARLEAARKEAAKLEAAKKEKAKEEAAKKEKK
jgi:hypothetical protein